MSYTMIFIIGMPRSGTTMLERILESHSMIMGGPEPHLLTPLAHLGYFDKVDKAPYDHILAAESQKLFVSTLPKKEQDYIDACRAYCDVLYGRLLTSAGKKHYLDKTPAYGLILPFLSKIYPDAKYIVLTRHPMAIFSSFANSFFDGDYATAQNYNPVLNRYIPAMARFLRQDKVSFINVRYEDLVKDPETWVGKIYEYIGIPFEKETIDYGKKEPAPEAGKGLGDPLGVKQHTRPTTKSVKKWVDELGSDQAKLMLMRGIISQIDPEDLKTFGYPVETLWKPLEEAGGKVGPPRKQKISIYSLQRKAIVKLRGQAQKGGIFRKALNKVRLTCDVLLRE
ncbi:MAG: hypothetical protein CO189_05230 [candidate division Zixibacteria bacterium CG_4_9_14_3_um_filter_46_8]|nr:MAG: hypothetical protein CO189_05230 [candidate division Zixibacteria bacterium CG_4_9_14_3_um_filter_46_8]